MAKKRTKAQIAKNIKTRIAPPLVYDPEKQVAANIEAISAINGAARAIEQFAIEERKSTDDLLKALQEIPRSAREQFENEKKLFARLVGAIVALDRELDTEKDPARRGELESLREGLVHRGRKAGNEIDSGSAEGPRNIKEALAEKYGLSVASVRQKGLIRGGISSFGKNVATGFKFLAGRDIYKDVAGTERPGSTDIEERVQQVRAQEDQHARMEHKLAGAMPSTQSASAKALDPESATAEKPDYEKEWERREALMRKGGGDAPLKGFSEDIIAKQKEAFMKENAPAETNQEVLEKLDTLIEVNQEIRDELQEEDVEEEGKGKIEARTGQNTAENLEDKALEARDDEADRVRKEREAAERLRFSPLSSMTPALPPSWAPASSTTAAALDSTQNTPSDSDSNIGSGIAGGGIAAAMMAGGKKILGFGKRAAVGAGRAAAGLGRAAAGTAGAISSSALATGAVGIGGLMAGMYAGDKIFNTSVADGGSGNLSDAWRYRGGQDNSPEAIARDKQQDIANKRKHAESVAKFAAQRATASSSKKESAAALASASVPDIAASSQPTITNITNNNSTSSNNNSSPTFFPPVRPNDNSFMRRQDRRTSRVV